MRRFLCILLAALCLSLCACGKKKAPDPEPLPAPVQTAAPLPDQTQDQAQPTPRPASSFPRSSYRPVEISLDNWQQYFTIREIPMYIVRTEGSETPERVIAAIYQNYCVVLRDEYQPYVDPEGDWSVQFSLRFDLYIDNQLDVDTRAYTYGHSSDLFYAMETEKTAVFDREALPYSAYGAEYGQYEGYRNAFFSGWATLDVENKVWEGFFLDPAQVTVTQAEGSISLALG